MSDAPTAEERTALRNLYASSPRVLALLDALEAAEVERDAERARAERYAAALDDIILNGTAEGSGWLVERARRERP